MRELQRLIELAGQQLALDVGPCHGAIARKVESLDLGESLTTMITCTWPRLVGGMLGPYRFRSAAQLLNYDELKSFLPDRELAIGDALCGDLLILSIDDPYPVSLFCHECIWEEESKRVEAHAAVSESFEDFISMALHEDDLLPIDFYAAKARNE